MASVLLFKLNTLYTQISLNINSSRKKRLMFKETSLKILDNGNDNDSYDKTKATTTITTVNCKASMEILKCVPYINQSTAHSNATSLRGRLTACSTSNMVTKPAEGIAAAPTAAAIAVTLGKKIM